jgi:hypothetical protein
MVNVFSFCLFGSSISVNTRVPYDELTQTIEIAPGGYYDGFIENAKLITKHYPDWKIYLYVGADVPDSFVIYLKSKFPNVVIRQTGMFGFQNTVHRFFAIDEPDVDVMFVRDCDNRVHWKDRWAIDTFLKITTRNFLIIRDHREHNGMAAGTWGVKKAGLTQSMQLLFEQWTPIFYGNGDPNDINGYGIDQNFLASVVYPRYIDDMFVIHSFGKVYSREIGINMPFHWTNDMYVGRVESNLISENFWLRERDTPPPEDIPIVFTDNRILPPKPREIWFQLHRS